MLLLKWGFPRPLSHRARSQASRCPPPSPLPPQPCCSVGARVDYRAVLVSSGRWAPLRSWWTPPGASAPLPLHRHPPPPVSPTTIITTAIEAPPLRNPPPHDFARSLMAPWTSSTRCSLNFFVDCCEFVRYIVWPMGLDYYIGYFWWWSFLRIFSKFRQAIYFYSNIC